MIPNSGIEIYQSSDGQTEIEVTFDNETVWLNQEQLGQLFERDRTVIGRHIRSIFKSVRGTQFRQWASQRLKEYLIKGYSINQKRLEQTSQELQILRSGIRILGRAIEDKAQEQDTEWLSQFAKGLKLLDDYDHEKLDSTGLTRRETVYPTKEDYRLLITQMKAEFSSDVFAIEKDHGFDSSINQISKGFGEQDFYPTIEEKAAVLPICINIRGF